MSQPWTKIVPCIFQVCDVCANLLWFVNWLQDLSLLEWSLLIIIFKWNWIWREGHVISAENQGEESYADQNFFHIVHTTSGSNTLKLQKCKHTKAYRAKQVLGSSANQCTCNKNGGNKLRMRSLSRPQRYWHLAQQSKNYRRGQYCTHPPGVLD